MDGIPRASFSKDKKTNIFTLYICDLPSEYTYYEEGEFYYVKKKGIIKKKCNTEASAMVTCMNMERSYVG